MHKSTTRFPMDQGPITSLAVMRTLGRSPSYQIPNPRASSELRSLLQLFSPADYPPVILLVIVIESQHRPLTPLTLRKAHPDSIGKNTAFGGS